MLQGDDPSEMISFLYISQNCGFPSAAIIYLYVLYDPVVPKQYPQAI